jgi:hypothetical protein
LITAEQYPVQVGKVALLKSGNTRLVFVLREIDPDEYGIRFVVTFEHDGNFKDELVHWQELETPEARMIEEAKFQKFVFDLTAQVNEQAKEAKKGPALVH